MKDESGTSGVRNPKRQDLAKRTRRFALSIVQLYGLLPKTTVAQILGKQILRSGTSIGANYSEAKRAKSNKDFINKIETALQKLEETVYWISLLGETKVVAADTLALLQKESEELIAIFVTVVRKIKSRG